MLISRSASAASVWQITLRLSENEHWLEAESSAFETAVQTTVGIGVGLFRLAFSAVVFLVVMGALAVGCLMLLS